MKNLPRVTAKIFASNANENDIGQFGSALSGTKLLTDNIEEIQALPAYEEGWRGAVLSSRNYPTLQEMNGLQKTFSQQIAYLLQKGLAEWDSATEYYTNDFCKVDNSLYYSLTDNNINNNPQEDFTNWAVFNGGGIPGDNFANTSLQNLTTLGNARLQYAPFSINSGTVINGNNHTLQTGSFIQSYSDAGSYTIEITEAGNYEIEMYGAGGGTGGRTVSGTYYIRGGGSGAGFKGVLNLPIGTYTVVVGSGGTGQLGWNSQSWVHGKNGGDSSFGNYITCGGGYSGATMAGGTLTYDSSVVVSTDIASNGNANTQGGGAGYYPAQSGGLSLYDNSHTGYGAGGYSSSNTNGENGFFKITKLTGSANEIGCNVCTLTTCDGRTVVDSPDTSLNVSSTADGEYSIFKNITTGELSLVSNFVIGKRQDSFRQPVLTSNGVLGGNSFAVQASSEQTAESAYLAFDGNASTNFQFGAAVPQNLTIYSPKPLNAKNIEITNYSGGGYSGKVWLEGNIYASNDNENFSQIGTFSNSNTSAGGVWNIDLSDNSEFYRYYKLEVTSVSGGSGSVYGIVAEIKITGNVKYDNVLDTTTVPANLYINSELNNDLVYIGDCAIASGVVTNITNRYLNACPYRRDLVDSYKNDTSWYAVYSDGWCEQGGFTTTTTGAIKTINLLKNFKDVSYSIFINLATDHDEYTNNFPCLLENQKQTDLFKISAVDNAAMAYLYWEAEGYIN